jgi:hypothetical protein
MKYFSLLVFVILVSCSSMKPKEVKTSDSDFNFKQKIQNLPEILDRAEAAATPEGKKILVTSRSMIAKKKIVVGSCWDYINAVYNKANYPANKRVTALKSKIVGPFADLSELQPGDWLYFINYSFSEIDHSGIFVEWIDVDKKAGVVMSYRGGKRKSPATYKIYDLKNVYYIIRPKTN